MNNIWLIMVVLLLIRLRIFAIRLSGANEKNLLLNLKKFAHEELQLYSNIISQTTNKSYLMMENLFDGSRAQGEIIRLCPDNFDLYIVQFQVASLNSRSLHQALTI